MANEAHKEPTMEEILASIRRIIAEDEPAPRPARAMPSAAMPTASSIGPASTSENDVAPVPAPADLVTGEDADTEVFETELEAGLADLDLDFGTDDATEPSIVPDFGGREDGFGHPADAGEGVSGIDLDFEAFDADFVSDTDLARTGPAAEPELPGVDDLDAAGPVPGEASVAPASVFGDEDGFSDAADAVYEEIVSGLAPAGPAAEIAEPSAKEPAPMPAAEKITADRLTDDNAAVAAASAMSKLLGRVDLGSSTSLEGLVRDMLKPLIKEWLDTNLPRIVEAKVEEEVQRISRMAR